jgi:flagellar assembly factor FliW
MATAAFGFAVANCFCRMPQVLTQQFGMLEYDDDAALDFPAGLPGFEHRLRFVLVERPAHYPIVFLQSLETPDLCFLAAPVPTLDPAYQLAMAPEDLRSLHLDEHRQPRIGRDVLCLAIICVPQNRPPTANLLAPVVINLANHRAVQSVRDDRIYSHEHPLDRRELAAGPCGSPSCTGDACGCPRPDRAALGAREEDGLCL